MINILMKKGELQSRKYGMDLEETIRQAARNFSTGLKVMEANSGNLLKTLVFLGYQSHDQLPQK